MFTSLVVAAQYSELLDGGWIVPCEVYAPAKRMRGAIGMPASDAVAQYSNDRQTIVFCSTVAESNACASLLSFYGARSVDGTTPGPQRDAVVSGFRDGSIRIVSNVYVFTEGFDAPNAEVCILARGSGHASTYLQMVGRVLRPSPQKTHATLIDLAGNVNDHGLPTDDREYSLTGDPIQHRNNPDSLWQCKSCGYITATCPPDRRCPDCSALMPEPKAQRIQRERLRRIEHAQRATESEKTASYRALRELAQARGYKPGWAGYRFKARYGHWPRTAV
jgi:superfamily II DNA or RNA helicase